MNESKMPELKQVVGRCPVPRQTALSVLARVAERLETTRKKVKGSVQTRGAKATPGGICALTAPPRDQQGFCQCSSGIRICSERRLTPVFNSLLIKHNLPEQVTELCFSFLTSFLAPFIDNFFQNNF